MLCAALVFVTAEVSVLAVIAAMLGCSFRRAWASYRARRKREQIICAALAELDQDALADLICPREAA